MTGFSGVSGERWSPVTQLQMTGGDALTWRITGLSGFRKVRGVFHGCHNSNSGGFRVSGSASGGADRQLWNIGTAFGDFGNGLHIGFEIDNFNNADPDPMLPNMKYARFWTTAKASNVGTIANVDFDAIAREDWCFGGLGVSYRAEVWDEIAFTATATTWDVSKGVRVSYQGVFG